MKDHLLSNGESSNDLMEHAQDITTWVRQAFCFGPTNKGKRLQVTLKFQRILKIITLIFENTEPKIYKKLKENNFLTDVDNLRKQAYRLVWIFEKTTYFVEKDPIWFLPLERITEKNSKILDIISLLYPFNQKNNPNSIWEELDITNLGAIFANYLLEFEAVGKQSEELNKNKSKNKVLTQREKHQYFLQTLYEPGKEAISQKDQIVFFDETLLGIERSIPYGTGNCGLMADLALLEVLHRQLNTKIFYVRFTNNSKKVEPLNVIIVGNFPKTNECIIISPWQGETGMCYVWKGSINETNELANFKIHNSYKILFTVNERNENDLFTIESHLVAKRDYFECTLAYKNYSRWFKSKEKQNLIQNHVTDFEKNLKKLGIIQEKKEPEKKWETFFQQEGCFGSEIEAEKWNFNTEEENQDCNGPNGPGYGF